MKSFPADRIRGEVTYDEPLARHTSLKVGGPADLFILPADVEDLALVLAFLQEQEIPFFVLGGGYNLLVRDGGFRGAAVSLKNLQGLSLDRYELIVEAGLPNIRAVDAAVTTGLSGLEFLACIPGSIGGALRMNAGAHGASIGDLVTSMTIVTAEGVREVPKQELTFGYRHFGLGDGEVIAGARLALSPAPVKEMKERIAAYREHRRQSQNVGYPSAGSFFKNPTQVPAWRLIDEAGFRGRRIGGAQVSENHCNFFVNRGGAKAADFLALAAEVKQEVFNRTGIILEEEVKLLGEDQ